MSPADTAAPAPTPMTLEHLDPSVLIADGNIRKDLRLTKEFVTSIAERGVLVPLVCVRTPDGVKIRYGHRRAFAAIQAGQPTVPCIVTDPAAGGGAAEADRILAQYDENTHREGLTTAENAGVVAGLLDLGLTAETIARQTQMHLGQVEAARRVAASKAATKAAGKYGFLDLGQAAGLAEFEDDQDALRELTAAAEHNPGYYQHTLQRLRDARDSHAVIAAARASAEADGITVLDTRPRYEWSIEQLTTAAGKRITEKGHRGCPGHAVYFRAGWKRTPGQNPAAVAEAEAYCTNPKANGHKPRHGTSLAPAGPQQTTEERREVIDRNKAWRSAETVRRTWLREYLARKTIPAPALRFVLEALAYGDPQLTACMSQWTGSHALARDLLGITKADTTGGLHANEVLAEILTADGGRAQAIALGIVLGAYESATSVQTWRHPVSQWAQRYFTLLKDLGYTLSDAEQLVLEPEKDAAR